MLENISTLKSHANFIISRETTHNIIIMEFIGDIGDEVYKEIWHTSAHFAMEYETKKFIIDQSKIGKVNFKSRSWAVLSFFPSLKKILGSNIAGSVITSKQLIHKSGVQYLIQAFRKFTGYQVNTCADYNEAINWLNSLH
ncbi:hypothetical protein [Flexithrix dorotheae]|uniref:hypothetical protein n=1 Tax=Flexithrix dorotheae TaxID=70993 RepID=UPI000369FC55|nr:hypothetical protein [Flexithrix dorotheae]